MFANGEITPASLSVSTQEIGLTLAKLRETHLKYHLAMMGVLTPAQVKHYRALRGYGPHDDHLRQHPKRH